MSSRERIAFEVPGLAPASWSGNSRSHWRKRHRDGDEYAELVYVSCRSQVPDEVYHGDGYAWTRAHLTLTQKAIRPRDVDNFLSSFKPGLDALTCQGKRSLGLVWDDSPECLSVEVRTERVHKRRDESVLVIIERIYDERETEG